MAADEDKSSDFYAVLGLKKECTPAELKYAYKKLALKWHPDRFCASGNSKYVEEAKKKFQAIQQAYSVLSDTNKRFLYDVGVYDCNDDGDENGMGEFLNEMAAMMSQTNPNENANESFEELQELFDEMFESDSFSSSSSSYGKRNSDEMGSRPNPSQFQGGFCVGTTQGGESSQRRKNNNMRRGRRW